MKNFLLPPDTQAILLLCGNFGQTRQTEPKPLNLSEYNKLATWLIQEAMTPADLLDVTLQHRLLQMVLEQIDSQRIIKLLQRGMMMSLSLEKWASQGIWVLGRGEEGYPKRLKQHLKQSAPPIIYGIGDRSSLNRGGLAIVGSRDVDADGIDYTQKIIKLCVQENLQVISGGARGVDKTAMLETLAEGGKTLGVLADSLLQNALQKEYREAIKQSNLTLISPYNPEAGFSVGAAMGRNKYIYALADYALVVSASAGKGGTWAGALEALQKMPNIPVFVRSDITAPEGNQQLLQQGAKAFPDLPIQSSLKQLLIPASTQTHPPVKSIYDLVLPLILECLETPQTPKFLKEHFQVREVQIKDWLEQAVAEGRVQIVKKSRQPIKYEINRQGELLSGLK